MQKLLFALSLGFGLLIFTQVSHAQGNNCADRSKVVTSLKSKYGETRRSMGLGKNHGVVEVFASDDTGTWTILITLPNGMACLLAAGEAFEQSAPLPVENGEPT